MKELIERYQEGGDIKEELTYLVPFVGTKKLWDRWKLDKSFENGIDLALSGVSDLTIPFAIGGGIKALSMGPKIARIVKAADKTAAVGLRFAKGAKLAKAVRNTKRADRLSRGARAAAKKADDLRFLAENLRGAQGVYKLQTLLPVSGATYKHMIYERNKPSNYVEKNNTKIYNTFLKKDGGIMKKLIPKHLSGSTLDKVVDAGGYLVPFYGTYKSYKDWEKNKTWGNALMTGVSGLGDALLLFGVGEGIKAIPAAKAAARMTKAADAIETGAKATREAAGLARSSGNVGLAEKLESKAFDQSVRASDKAFEASLLSSRAKGYKDLATYSAEGSTYTKAGFGPRGSQGNKNSKKLNLVEKRSSSLASTYYPKFK